MGWGGEIWDKGSARLNHKLTRSARQKSLLTGSRKKDTSTNLVGALSKLEAVLALVVSGGRERHTVARQGDGAARGRNTTVASVDGAAHVVAESEKQNNKNR